MIHGRLRPIGRPGVPRESYSHYPEFKHARDKADDELMAILLQVEEQTGEPPAIGDQGAGEPMGSELGEMTAWLDLKRIAAWLEGGELPPGPRTEPDPAADGKLAPFLTGNAEPGRFPHLLRHAESSGYYVPLDFPCPFWLAEQQLSVGSAPRLAAELAGITAALKPRKNEFPDEWVLLRRLHERAEQAVRENVTLELGTTPFCGEPA